MISRTEGKIADKDITQVSFCKTVWKQSPGHPNSMQKHKTQEHDAGETARDNLEAKSRSLEIHRMEYEL